MQGMGGLMSITGHADGEPGAGPMKVGVALTDVLTGLYATTAILAALAHRDQASGSGQHIDLALLDVQVACLANQNMNYLHGGQVPRRLGNAHPNVVPYQDFPTADGDMILAIGNDSQFAKLCRAIGRPEWALDERFADQPARVANRADADPAAAHRDGADAAPASGSPCFEAAGVPCGPINDIAQVFADPQIVARGMKIDDGASRRRPDPAGRQPAAPVGDAGRLPRPPPRLGEHTREVLDERA